MKNVIWCNHQIKSNNTFIDQKHIKNSNIVKLTIKQHMMFLMFSLVCNVSICACICSTKLQSSHKANSSIEKRALTP